MQLMQKEYGIIFTTVAGNYPGKIEHYPAYAETALTGMMVVGASDKEGFPWAQNGYLGLWPGGGGSVMPVTFIAPGVDLAVPQSMKDAMDSASAGEGANPITGTSYGKLRIATHRISITRPTPGLILQVMWLMKTARV